MMKSGRRPESSREKGAGSEKSLANFRWPVLNPWRDEHLIPDAKNRRESFYLQEQQSKLLHMLSTWNNR